MESAKGILVFLACVFVAADCLSPSTEYQDSYDYIDTSHSDSEHEEIFQYIPSIFDYSVPSHPNSEYEGIPHYDYIDTPHSNCEERRVTCWRIMHSETVLSSIARDIHGFADNIDEFCTELQHDSACFQWLDECFTLSQDYSWDQYLMARLSSVEYICSESGRELLEAARHSPCYFNSVRLYAVSELTRNCLSSLPEIQEDVYHSRECQLIAQWTQCESQAATQECGQAIGTLFRELRNKEDAVYYPNCSSSSSSLEEALSCIHDSERISAILRLVSTCIRSSPHSQEYGEYSVCRDVETRTQCLVQATNQVCGQGFGTIVLEMVDTNDFILECIDGSS